MAIAKKALHSCVFYIAFSEIPLFALYINTAIRIRTHYISVYYTILAYLEYQLLPTYAYKYIVSEFSKLAPLARTTRVASTSCLHSVLQPSSGGKDIKDFRNLSIFSFHTYMLCRFCKMLIL